MFADRTRTNDSTCRRTEFETGTAEVLEIIGFWCPKFESAPAVVLVFGAGHAETSVAIVTEIDEAMAIATAIAGIKGARGHSAQVRGAGLTVPRTPSRIWRPLRAKHSRRMSKLEPERQCSGHAAHSGSGHPPLHSAL
eukprot:SAG31_NODE_3691_length_3985_cov_3.675244_6_plen_138_part_00